MILLASCRRSLSSAFSSRAFCFAALALLNASSTRLEAQAAHLVANQMTIATSTNLAEVPVQAVRDAAGNLFELSASGAVYRLTSGCLDYTACGGTAIIAATAGNVDVGLDSAGAVYVANGTAKTVTKYIQTAGVYAGTVVVTTGEGSDTTLAPAALDLDMNANIYVAVNGTHPGVYKFSPACHSDSVSQSCATDVLQGALTGVTFTSMRIVGIQELGYGTGLAYAYNTASSATLHVSTLGGTNVSSVTQATAGHYRSMSSDVAGNLYAGFAAATGSGFLTEISASCQAGNCVAFNLMGVSTPAAVASDGVRGVYVYDAQGASNRVVNYATGLADFGTSPIASAASGQAISYFGFDAAGTPGGISVVTGGAINQDFTVVAAGTTCNTSTAFNVSDVCTVQTSFTPKAPGARLGAVTLDIGMDNTTAFATAFLEGMGTGPRGLFTNGIVSTLYPGYGGAFRGPSSDGAGNTYIADTNDSQLLRIAANGATTALQSTVMSGATTVDGAGNVFYSATDGTYQNNSMFELMGGAGVPIKIATIQSPDNTFAVDSAGDVYYTDVVDASIHKVTVSNGSDSTILPGQPSSRFISIFFGPDGDLYIADFAQSQIDTLAIGSQTLTPLLTGTNGINQPQGLSVDAAGVIYVTNSNNAPTLRFAPGAAQGVSIGNMDCCGITQRPDGSLVTMSDTIDLIDRTSVLPLSFTAATGGTSTAQIFQYENDGSTPLHIASVVITPSNFTIDTATTTCVAGPLSVGAVCQVGVKFTAPPAAGTSAGSVVIIDDSLNAAAATHTVNLSGLSETPVLTSFALTGMPASIVAGTLTGPVTVTALDQSADAFPTFSGILNVSSSDQNPAAVLPSTIQITNGAGQFSFIPVTALTGGISASITVQDPISGVSGVQDFIVTTGSAATVSISSPTISAKTAQTFGEAVSITDAYGNALANALPVTAAVVPGAGGAGATATQNPIAAPATQYFAVNGTPGTFIINFTSPGVAAARATVTTTLPDTFLVTVNTDPSANFYQGNPTLCVNQNMSSGYQPGSGDNTDCSLRDAVAAANGTTEAVITFANSVGSIATPGTILLGHVIECNTAVTITGPGSAALTLDGSQAGGSGIFMMASNDTTVLGGITLLNSDSLAVFNAGGSIALNDVIINGASNSDMADLYGTVSIINSSFLNTTNGNVGLNIGDQGSISNSIFRGNSGPALFLESSSSVQVTNTVFLGNSSVNSSLQGAAINSQGGSLSVSSSTFSGNTGNSSSTINMDNSSNATIVNSTFTNNAASGAGTVTANGGAITVSDSTFYNNQQSTAQQIVGTATVTNSIVAGANGSATSTGNCSTCTFHGNNIIDVDPQLAALADNGSSSMQHPVLMTLLPMPGSLAVCTGAATSDTTDERGFPRPTLNGSRSCIDIGAVQTAYTIAFSTQPGDTPVFSNITPAPVVTVTEHSAAIAGVALVISDSSGIGSLTGITTGVTGPGGTTNFNALVTRKGGTQSLAATANFAAVTSSPFRVTAVPPIVMLAISPALQTYGTAVIPGTFSASATYAGNAVPGTFAYIATPNSGSPVTVAQGTTVLPAASYRVVADFTPTDSANYNANSSLSGATTYTVAPGTAAITFDVPDHTFGDAPFIVSAISLSTGAFMYSLVSGPATVDGNAVTLSGPGTVVLQAAQAADANYITNSKQASFTVTRIAAPFTLSDAGATTYSVILAKGTTARTTITVTPSAGFSGAIAMSCALLPANADCSFSSPTLNFFGSGAAQTTGLSIQTQTSMKAMLQQPGNRIRSCLAMTFWLPSLLLAGSGFRNRGLRGGSRLLILGIVMLWCIGATGLTGCGSNPTPINTTAEGTYMFNIVATHGSITQRLPVTLTIQ